MMEKVFKSWWFIILVLIAFVIGIWWYMTRQCPKKRIKVKVLSLAEKSDPQTVITTLLKLNKIEDDVEIVDLGSLLGGDITLETQSVTAYNILKDGLEKEKIKYTTECAKV